MKLSTMLKKLSIPAVGLAVMTLGIVNTSLAAVAATFTVTLPEYNSSMWWYPSGGNVTFGKENIPFNLPSSGNNYWNSYYEPGGRGNSVIDYEIPVNIFGVTEVYTLLDTYWGRSGKSYASLTFNGSLGATYKIDLLGNYDIRDYNQNSFTNAASNVEEVFNNGRGQRLDMQSFILPEVFSNQTLESITLEDRGSGASFQRIFISGLTVESVPKSVPEHDGILGLLAVGALGVITRKWEKVKRTNN